NASFSLTLATGRTCDKQKRTCLKDLCDEHKNAINEQLRAEHGLTEDPDFAPLAYLIVTDLSLEDNSGHTKGKLVSFLERTRPNSTYPVGALYKALFEEIKRRANYEGEGLDLPGLLAHKGMSRTYFSKLLDDLPETKSFDTIWQTISAQLTAE